MHPAPSIIVFTVVSGAGYGLLGLLGILVPAGLVPADRWLGVLAMTLALSFVATGLIASTLHLGRPERAWRALTQWRSSWLSREGVAAAATFVPAGLFALGWVLAGRTHDVIALLGAATAAMSVITVFSTAMIYASIKPVRQWRDPRTPVTYLGFALATGATWLLAVLKLYAIPSDWPIALAGGLLAIAWIAKGVYWRAVDAKPVHSTIASATGLGAWGAVDAFDPPHTEENYLLHEMAYRVARKHARRLRVIAVGLGCPTALALLAMTALADGPVAALTAVLAAGTATAGVAVERWLFFAEATHTVTLYYGAEAA